MAMTEKSLLKYFDEFISNEYFAMVDYELDKTPSINKESVIKSIKEKIEKLKICRKNLAEILNAK